MTPYQEQNATAFESPIEEILLPQLKEYLSPGTEMILQKELETPNGHYRPDALLVNGSEILAIECDGKDFHTSHSQELYDLWRDAFLLFDNCVDYIYRFSGREIHYFLSDIIYLLSKEQPQFFDTKKVRRLSTNFQNYFHERSEIRYNNKICIAFQDPEEEHLSYSQRQKGFYYSYRDKKDWFPDFGPEALLMGELFPGQSAKQLMDSFKFGLGDKLFSKVEQQKPGALLKYIHFFKNTYNYVGEKGKLIKKYKELAGYPLQQYSPQTHTQKLDYQSENVEVWNTVVKKIIPLKNLPQTLKWTDSETIISAIQLLRGHDNHIVTFLPDGGNSHLFDVKEGYEEGFVEIHTGSYVHIGRPKSLEFMQVTGWPELGFFRLIFDELSPIKFHYDNEDETERREHWNLFQLLLEFRPGTYSDEITEKKSYERIVKRYTGGQILFFRNCSDSHPLFKIAQNIR
jgi:hypothetical protein